MRINIIKFITEIRIMISADREDFNYYIKGKCTGYWKIANEYTNTVMNGI